MKLRAVTLKLSPEMLRASARIASEQDVTVGQLVRDLLRDEIRKRQKARPPIRAEEQLVAPLRARLAQYLSTCETWEDLQAQLKCQGYHLKEAGGGLALYSHPEDQRICKASELGLRVRPH